MSTGNESTAKREKSAEENDATDVELIMRPNKKFMDYKFYELVHDIYLYNDNDTWYFVPLEKYASFFNSIKFCWDQLKEKELFFGEFLLFPLF